MRERILYILVTGVGGILLFVVLPGYSIGEQVMVAVLNRSDLTAFEIRGEYMYLAGELNTRTPGKLKKVINDNPQVTTLVLTKMPGSLDDETLFPFARWVRQKGLHTHLESTSEIASGAVDFFLAGNRRTMQNGAGIGVHSWADGEKQASDYPRSHSAHRLNAEYIATMLGSEEFYWFTINAAPADGIHWMTKAEIEEFRLLTTPPLRYRKPEQVPPAVSIR